MGFQELPACDAAQRPQLKVDVAALGVHGVGYFLPRGDLRVVVDARCVGVSAGAGGDGGCFADEEGAGDRGALGVVFLHDGEGGVVIVGAEAGHGCHCDAVGELDAADTERGEEFSHLGSWLIFELYCNMVDCSIGF